MSTLLAELDGVDVTNVSIAGSWTPRLNRPAQAQITIPMDAAIGDVGSRLKLTIDGTLVFHGFVLNTETDTNKDDGTTVYNAQDPMELWQWRPVRDDDGDFSKPGIIANYVDAPSIMLAALMNTVDTTAGGGGPPPSDAEGPIFLTLGSFDTGGPSVVGAPVDWPMTIQQLSSLLISAGVLDMVIVPTDPGGGVMGEVTGYNGNFGTDLSGSVIFQYGMGAHNVDSLRWNRDMSSIVNKYWIYSGPSIATAAVPAGDQHWCLNITGDDPGLCGNVGTPTCTDRSGAVTHGPGGAIPTSVQYDGPQAFQLIGDKRYDSQITAGPSGTGYGVRMKIDIFDAYDDGCIRGFGTPGRQLYRRIWQEYSWIAAGPREIIHVTPTRDTEIGTFGIGDLVTVEASAAVRGGFSGVQRIYEYTISWDEDSVLALGELQTSSDADFTY
jgi:hypothetical protein